MNFQSCLRGKGFKNFQVLLSDKKKGGEQFNLATQISFLKQFTTPNLVSKPQKVFRKMQKSIFKI